MRNLEDKNPKCEVVGRAYSRATPDSRLCSKVLGALRARLADTLAPPRVAAVLGLLLLGSAQAFPPVPHHLLYGQVRDELGNPLTLDNAEVLLQMPSGKIISAPVRFGQSPGVNYKLEVPMDAGLDAAGSRPTAMRPYALFTMRVRVRNEIFLPIELAGDFREIGRPGKKTYLDLTLGVDSDGDGLPDAWERELLDQLSSLEDVNPDDDSDGDGLSNLEEYLSGSYAGSGENEFKLEITGFHEDRTLLQFRAVTGRTYSIQASNTLEVWEDVPFYLSDSSEGDSLLEAFPSSDVEDVQISVPVADGDKPEHRFFKLIVR